MKKIILLIIIIIIAFLLFKKEDVEITGDSIRFRVIANSNSSKDIIMKEKIVKQLSRSLFIKDNYQNTKDNIINNLSLMENTIDKLFDDNNYNETYNITYGLNEFPEKKLNNIIYPKGLYESLVIEIGSAEGNNYWCFLYPSLCLIDDYSTDETEYKFRIVELIKKVF